MRIKLGVKNLLPAACLLAAAVILVEAGWKESTASEPAPQSANVAIVPFERSSSSAGNEAASPITPMSVKPAAAAKKDAPSVTLSQNEIDPGETLYLTLRGVDDASSVTVQNDFGYAVRFTSLGDGTFLGFLPISYHTQPGVYSVSVSAGFLKNGGVSFSVRVSDKQFELQQLIVEEKVADDTIFNDEATVEYRQRIWPMKEVYDDERYFDGPFIHPLPGELTVTTQFGMLRTVNGKPNPRHDGVDLSAGTGTPVYAAQNGRVLFADFVKLTGNTVIIEHGCGLKSWYMHMDSLDVQPGDQVKTGDEIGKVGATGFVTGPHLHFSASVNGVYINPFTLTDTDFLAHVAPEQPKSAAK